MDFEHMRAVEQCAAQESELGRLRADLERAERLLGDAGIHFARTPDPTRRWVKPAPAPETTLHVRSVVTGHVAPGSWMDRKARESGADGPVPMAGFVTDRRGVGA